VVTVRGRRAPTFGSQFGDARSAERVTLATPSPLFPPEQGEGAAGRESCGRRRSDQQPTNNQPTNNQLAATGYLFARKM